MANLLYPLAKQHFLAGDIDLVNDDIRVILIDTADYTYSAAHEYLSDVAAGAREEVSGAMTGKSITGGVFDAADVTFSAATGDPCEALIIYQHTGTDGTSILIAYIDSATGLPITLNGGDATVVWNASGIFAL